LDIRISILFKWCTLAGYKRWANWLRNSYRSSSRSSWKPSSYRRWRRFLRFNRGNMVGLSYGWRLPLERRWIL